MYFICNHDQLEAALDKYAANRNLDSVERWQLRDTLYDFLTSPEARAAKIAQGELDDSATL